MKKKNRIEVPLKANAIMSENNALSRVWQDFLRGMHIQLYLICCKLGTDYNGGGGVA